MQTALKVLGIVAVIWIAFMVLGWVLSWVFTLLAWVLVIGAVLFVGSAAYAALKSKSDRRALPR